MRENNCRERPTKEQFSMWRRRSGHDATLAFLI
jgi:hypothetical protein